MRNPYEVLGVASSADIDEIKRAYRAKASLYENDPEKMSELNDAYDTIILSGKSASGGYDAYSRSEPNNDGLGDIRAKLNAGRTDDAEMLLDGIPQAKRTAEWYYLKGTIHQRRGWLESAAECFQKAIELEPGNSEYRSAYESIRRSRTGQYRVERNDTGDGCCDSPCKLCSSLLCADCCCECMGGDLIRCC